MTGLACESSDCRRACISKASLCGGVGVGACVGVRTYVYVHVCVVWLDISAECSYSPCVISIKAIANKI